MIMLQAGLPPLVTDGDNLRDDGFPSGGNVDDVSRSVVWRLGLRHVAVRTEAVDFAGNLPLVDDEGARQVVLTTISLLV